MAIQIALLRELSRTVGARELGLDPALVVLVPPQRREERVGLVAVLAHVLHLALGLRPGRHNRLLIRRSGCVPGCPDQRDAGPFALALHLLLLMAALALVDAMAYQCSANAEVTSAVRTLVALAVHQLIGYFGAQSSWFTRECQGIHVVRVI